MVAYALFLALGACQNSATLSQSNRAIQPDNFILYVSNQSFEISPVDIKILIDGKIIIDDLFEVNNQHNWREFRFYFSSGKHVLNVVSKRGEAELQSEFTVTEKHWAAVAFWFYPDTHHTPTPRQFTFIIQDTPILFQ